MELKGVKKDSLRKSVGAFGEQIAAKFLVHKGFKIIGRNYRKPWGEIDIIAEKDGVVRFVEVKTISRENTAIVSKETSYRPEEQVHAHKLRKISRTAELYMHERNDGREYQIDVVGVILDKSARMANCRLFEQVL